MTKIDRIEKSEDGTLLIRWIKDDGVYHRTSIPPDFDIDEQLDNVDRHLESMGHGKMKAKDRSDIKAKRPKP